MAGGLTRAGEGLDHKKWAATAAGPKRTVLGGEKPIRSMKIEPIPLRQS